MQYLSISLFTQEAFKAFNFVNNVNSSSAIGAIRAFCFILSILFQIKLKI